MKKILFSLLLISSFASGQIKVCQLPQANAGSQSDWVIVEDSACLHTQRMTISDFISIYGIGGSGGGGSAGGDLNGTYPNPQVTGLYSYPIVQEPSGFSGVMLFNASGNYEFLEYLTHANGEVLKVNSATTSGLEWAAPSATVDTTGGNTKLTTHYQLNNTDSVGTLTYGVWNGTVIDTAYSNSASRVTAGMGMMVTKQGKTYKAALDSVYLNLAVDSFKVVSDSVIRLKSPRLYLGSTASITDPNVSFYWSDSYNQISTYTNSLYLGHGDASLSLGSTVTKLGAAIGHLDFSVLSPVITTAEFLGFTSISRDNPAINADELVRKDQVDSVRDQVIAVMDSTKGNHQVFKFETDGAGTGTLTTIYNSMSGVTYTVNYATPGIVLINANIPVWSTTLTVVRGSSLFDGTLYLCSFFSINTDKQIELKITDSGTTMYDHVGIYSIEVYTQF